MRPSNQKSIYAVICKNIEEVDNCEAQYLEEKIQKLDALVRASRMATDMMITEHQRAKLKKELSEYNKSGEKIELREIESKGFDDTTHIKDNFTDY